MHLGEPKIWYGIPPSGAEKFDATFAEMKPEMVAAHPDITHHITTQLNPNDLTARGVPIYRLVQNARDFVFTFPRAYHAGISTGVNCGEAVNFATPAWLSAGVQALAVYRPISKKPIFNVHELAERLFHARDWARRGGQFYARRYVWFYSVPSLLFSPFPPRLLSCRLCSGLHGQRVLPPQLCSLSPPFNCVCVLIVISLSTGFLAGTDSFPTMTS